jgi:hypothetical protein
MTTTLRPEDRQRRRPDPAPWADTLPTFFRSEAFAEDLEGPAVLATAPVAVGSAPRGQALAWGILPRLAWR